MQGNIGKVIFSIYENGTNVKFCALGTVELFVQRYCLSRVTIQQSTMGT